MMPTYKISLQVDHPQKRGSYYSLRVKQALSFEPSEYKQPRRILVFSDISGDFHYFTKQLLKRKIVDKYLHWTFGDGHVVILGDRFDAKSQATDCLWLIYALEEQARRQGGYVHFILSNLELLKGSEWRSMHPKYADKQPISGLPTTALYHGNNELWHWLRTKNVVEKIGHSLFVHRGIVQALNSMQNLSAINNLIRRSYTPPEHSNTQHEMALLTEVDNSMNYQGYHHRMITEAQIDATLLKFGVSTIIATGNMVGPATSLFNGKLILVNTSEVPGTTEGLFITRKRFYSMGIRGKDEQLK